MKKYIPKSTKKKVRSILTLLSLMRNAFYDFYFYFKSSATLNNKKNKVTHSSELIFYYHKIEKGLALPNPKVGFGKDAINYLLDSLEDYVNKYGWDRVSNISLNTLSLYKQFNESNNNYIDDVFSRIELLTKHLNGKHYSDEGGIINTTREEILASSSINFKDFANKRYSIRNYSNEEVKDETILEAIKIAQKTPSVCNRQSSKVHIFSNKDIQKKALSFQNGNAGFGDKAGKVLLVTADIEDFFGAGERHQAYIDGGMFAMSLIYGLHSLGLGSCALNLALDYRKEAALKKSLGIDTKEVLIMMIAVGHLPDELAVAASPRKQIEEITKLY